MQNLHEINGNYYDDSGNMINGSVPLTPQQAEQAGREALQYQDAQNLQVYQTTPTTEAQLTAKYTAAKQGMQQLQNGGLSFKPPSAMRQIVDMVGGALITYFMCKSGGMNGNGAGMAAFMAAAANHDNDRKIVDRFNIAKQLYAKGGYTPDALYKFVESGDESALKAETTSIAENERQERTQEFEAMTQGKTQEFQAMQQNDRFSHQTELEKMREDYRSAHPLAGGAMSVVDENGMLTNHGMIASNNLANQIRQTKAPYVRGLQMRMQKLASAQGMIPQIQQAIQRGDWTTAQTLYNSYLSDLAQANKGGNSSISESDKKELNDIGGIINQGVNAVRKGLGYTPNENTMNAMFNNMQAIQANDEQALNNEVAKEVQNIGGGVVHPSVVKYVASILLNQQIGAGENTGSSVQVSNTGNSSTLNIPNSQLSGYVGQSTDKPNGYTVTNGKITLVAENGKWTMQD